MGLWKLIVVVEKGGFEPATSCLARQFNINPDKSL